MNRLLIANVAILVALLAATSILGPTIFKGLVGLLPNTITLFAVTPEAGLVSIFMMAIVVSLMIYMPIGMVSLYYYLRPALYANELKFIQNNILLGIALFMIGVSFGFVSYLTFGIPFFIWANNMVGIQNFWSVSALVYQMMCASLAVGLAFLFPIALNNLIRYNFIRVETLKKNRKVFIIGLALVIVIVPFLPNNPIEQLAVGIPIYLLYEATIYFNSRRQLVKATDVVLT